MVCAVCALCWAAIAFVAYLVARYLWELIPVGDLKNKAVLITGCDSGFGRSLALKCAKNGLTVFAGCLTDDGVASLKKEDAGSGSLLPIKLDITKDDSVKAAREFVDSKLGSKKFWAVVNNAGIFTCYGPADWCGMDEYRLSFEVNTLGGIRVTDAFYDLLKLYSGRIISVSSVAGRLSTAGTAAYSVAKYGVEAWMDSIRRELIPYGISVSIIEPGIFKATNLLDETAMNQRVDAVWAKMTPERRAEYGDDYKKLFLTHWHATMQSGSNRIDYVVDNYYHAITAAYPRLRYQCGWDAILLWMPLSFLPTPMQDFILRKLFAATYSRVPAALKEGGKYAKKTN